MINMHEYAARRKNLMAQLKPNSVVFVTTAPENFRNGDTHYAYRQNSDFYYLTGFEEPEAVLVLCPGRKEGEFILFNRQRDLSQEIWNGPRLGQDGAVDELGAAEAYPIEEFEELVYEILEDVETIYYPIGRDGYFDELLMEVTNHFKDKVRAGVSAPVEFINVEPLIHEMRLFKSPAEIDLLREVSQITAKAHVRAMNACQPGMMEYQLEGEIRAEFFAHGSRETAYEPIVGSGENACILHYVSNNAPLKDGDLVLIDAGAELHNYAADITRTFPVNGKFSPEQKAIYDLVLESQLAAIELVKPGTRWNELQKAIVEIITRGLVELKILHGDVDHLIESGAYRHFYMHNSGHWIGLDVHDVGAYKVKGEWRELKPGMVMTIEPGIYIGANHDDVDPKWWNIGVRIEDDVLVTEDGCEVLTKDVPKSAAEVEALVG